MSHSLQVGRQGTNQNMEWNGWQGHPLLHSTDLYGALTGKNSPPRREQILS